MEQNGNNDERRDARARASDLDRMAREATDATFGDGDDETAASRVRVPGVLSGEIGPKGAISAQHRDLSRTQPSRLGEVPHGTVAPGGARLLLFPVLALAVALLIIAALLGWLLS